MFVGKTSFPDVHLPHWFVLFVRTNQEKTTATHLAGLEVEHFLPCVPSLSQWKDRRVVLERPLFPGYVFVRFREQERLRILNLPGVLYQLTAGSAPATVSEEEILWVRRGLLSGTAAPHEHLLEGQQVIITTGALAGLKGILLRRMNNTRVVVSLDSIGRSFSVEVDINSVEPLAGQKRPSESSRPSELRLASSNSRR
jgi:transcription antitermination factor NusG